MVTLVTLNNMSKLLFHAPSTPGRQGLFPLFSGPSVDHLVSIGVLLVRSHFIYGLRINTSRKWPSISTLTGKTWSQRHIGNQCHRRLSKLKTDTFGELKKKKSNRITSNWENRSLKKRNTMQQLAELAPLLILGSIFSHLTCSDQLAWHLPPTSYINTTVLSAANCCSGDNGRGGPFYKTITRFSEK